MAKFFQSPPQIPRNTYSSDSILQRYLRKTVPQAILPSFERELTQIGLACGGEFLKWSTSAELHPPELTQFDPWGRRLDEIKMDSGWTHLEHAAAQYGVVSTAYEKKFGAQSRVLQMALLYLYSPSSAFVSCPLAMTDGAARVLSRYLSEPELKNAFDRLTSRDPAQFWTSGQWMTERIGGSDVSQTETVARLAHGNHYQLFGDKWFTSATTSQMALTLARVEGHEHAGLSLFFVPIRNADGSYNSIRVNRLKDKLGTRALPTAELTLDGTRARLLGEVGQGVKSIAPLLNITRLYNSICALGHMRRALDLAHDYAHKRMAFAKHLIEHDLHRVTLENLEQEFQKCFAFTFFVVELLGKEEAGVASSSEVQLLRSLTPLVKLYTGKKVVALSSEVIECFGGAGYIEDTGLPRLLRDAQVFSIWEGTTNVLSLDFLRATKKENALVLLREWFENKKANELFSEIEQLDLENISKARDNCFFISEKIIAVLLRA